MKLSAIITEDVISDAKKVDELANQAGISNTSVAGSLDLLRTVDTDTFAQRAEEVWGTDPDKGGNTLIAKLDACDKKIEKSSDSAIAWTGETNDAFQKKLKQVKEKIAALRNKIPDMAHALDEISEAWSIGILGWVGLIMSLLGLVASAFGVWEMAAGGVSSLTGVGAIGGVPMAIIGAIMTIIGALSAIGGFLAMYMDLIKERGDELDGALKAVENIRDL